MQTPKHAVISAAGLGSRLELNMPKCLVEIAGRKVIDYQLDLLRDIEDVRIVVGFMEEAVISHVRELRSDVLFVRNSDYRTTSNSYSLFLATKDLPEPFVAIDGDLLIETASFSQFLARCHGPKSVIGITESKTEEAVFVDLDDAGENVINFTREKKCAYEWSGLAYLANIPINQNQGYLYREIERHLPLPAQKVKCFEIDTPEDLNAAIEHFRP